MRAHDYGSSVPLYSIACPKCGSATEQSETITTELFTCTNQCCDYEHERDKPQYIEDRHRREEES